MVIAFLVNPTSSFAESDARQVEAAARALGQHVEVIKASTEQEVEAAFATLVDLRADTLLVDPDPFFNSQSRVERVATLTLRHALPAMHSVREFVIAGGLMSYAPSLVNVYRQVGIYAGRVLKGEKPADSAHLATADRRAVPHVVPVCFAILKRTLYITIDEKPKRISGTALKRLRNIAENPAVAVGVDHYNEDWDRLGWVMLRGRAEILSEGTEHRDAQALLRSRYPQLAAMQIAKYPVIAVRIERVTSWGNLSVAIATSCTSHE